MVEHLARETKSRRAFSWDKESSERPKNQKKRATIPNAAILSPKGVKTPFSIPKTALEIPYRLGLDSGVDLYFFIQTSVDL